MIFRSGTFSGYGNREFPKNVCMENAFLPKLNNILNTQNDENDLIGYLLVKFIMLDLYNINFSLMYIKPEQIRETSNAYYYYY